MSSQKNYNKNNQGVGKKASNNRKAKLGSKEMGERMLEWITFYRRNPQYLVSHYFGIKLHWFQSVMIYLMEYFPEFVFVATRGIGKSFIIGVYVCVKAVLFPGSKIVVSSKTKKQASLILTAKIYKELRSMSPVLANEIEKMTTNNGDVEIKFWNGSTINVVPATENARGMRATVNVYEEYRQINKDVLDAVLSPFLEIRQPPYSIGNPEYSDLEVEEPKELYISSAWKKDHWMWDIMKIQVKDAIFSKNPRTAIFTMDYSSVIKYKMKTINQIKKDKKKLGALAFSREYENIQTGENEDAFFSYNQLNPARLLKKGFYPRMNFLTKQKNKDFKYLIKKEGELRILAVDVSMMSSAKGDNDNTVLTCIRALPAFNHYKRQVPYIEAYEGGLTQKQALRIKQVFYDFECDVCVLDTNGVGIGIYDSLAQITYDPDRDIEYDAWHSINNDEHRNRIIVSGSQEVIFSITGSAGLNNQMHLGVERALDEGKIELLITEIEAKEKLDDISDSYAKDQLSGTEKAILELPYLETDMLADEMTALKLVENVNTGHIKLIEPRSGRKDRYLSFGYGNYYIDILELELINENGNSTEDDDLVYY